MVLLLVNAGERGSRRVAGSAPGSSRPASASGAQPPRLHTCLDFTRLPHPPVHSVRCCHRYARVTESYIFWRIFPWVASIFLFLFSNLVTLLYALRYFAFSDTLFFAWCAARLPNVYPTCLSPSQKLLYVEPHTKHACSTCFIRPSRTYVRSQARDSGSVVCHRLRLPRHLRDHCAQQHELDEGHPADAQVPGVHSPSQRLEPTDLCAIVSRFAISTV